jgi:hypothetical protein
MLRLGSRPDLVAFTVFAFNKPRDYVNFLHLCLCNPTSDTFLAVDPANTTVSEVQWSEPNQLLLFEFVLLCAMKYSKYPQQPNLLFSISQSNPFKTLQFCSNCEKIHLSASGLPILQSGECSWFLLAVFYVLPAWIISILLSSEFLERSGSMSCMCKGNLKPGTGRGN